MVLEIVLVAAVAKNPCYEEHDVLGFNGEIPWHRSDNHEMARVKRADVRHFNKLTTQKGVRPPVIMGRVTYEEILRTNNAPLADRENIVLSRREDYDAQGFSEVRVVSDTGRALALADTFNVGVAFVIGGRFLYEAFMPHAGRIELTEIHKPYAGDVFFPGIRFGILRKSWREDSRQDKQGYSFVSYVRKNAV